MHLNSALLFKKYATPFFKNKMRVLEIGPAGNPSFYQSSAGNETITWETLNLLDTDGVTYVASNEYKFPVPDNTFDIVLSGQVIEHVKKTWLWIKEVARVCKQGGTIITIAPVSWPYHEAPVDCWRIYPTGMQALYDEAGIKMEFCKFESLEDPQNTKIPGAGSEAKLSITQPTLRSTIKEMAKTFLKRPRFCAVDTIAIGTKI